jgi:hypothetical protein
MGVAVWAAYGTVAAAQSANDGDDNWRQRMGIAGIAFSFGGIAARADSSVAAVWPTVHVGIRPSKVPHLEFGAAVSGLNAKDRTGYVVPQSGGLRLVPRARTIVGTVSYTFDTHSDMLLGVRAEAGSLRSWYRYQDREIGVGSASVTSIEGFGELIAAWWIHAQIGLGYRAVGTVSTPGLISKPYSGPTVSFLVRVGDFDWR